LASEHLPSRFVRRTPQDPITRVDEALAFEDTWRPPEWFSQVVVVLVEPTDPVNIGAVIRAMGNTGFVQLRLVRPVEFTEWQIIGIAHYTQHIFESIGYFDSLQAATADAQLVLCLTGRHHREKRDRLPLAEAVERVVDAAQANQRVAIVFGREDSGLNNEQLDACHAVSTIPTNPANPSLNLAQAALLVLYQVFLHAGGGQRAYRRLRKRSPLATSALLEDLFADLERTLDAIGFLQQRSRVHAMRSLRVALFRARLDVREASLLRAIVLEVRHFLHRRGVLAEVGEIGARRPADLTAPDSEGMLDSGPHEAMRPEEGGAL
jgi:TrmH family RNA methyltransferase